MEEIWKDIEGYRGMYQVSNMGRVRSVDRIVDWRGSKQLRKGRILKGQINIDGYYQVGLSKNGKLKMHKVHRLVAEAYLENENNLPCINHKDECKTNNHVSNLEFCSYKYNNEYSGIYEKSAEVCSKPVIQMNKNGEFVAEYQSASEAYRQTGITRGNISNCCNGRKYYKSAGGYIWRYKEKTP